MYDIAKFDEHGLRNVEILRPYVDEGSTKADLERELRKQKEVTAELTRMLAEEREAVARWARASVRWQERHEQMRIKHGRALALGRAATK